jgi:hypothetical protein
MSFLHGKIGSIYQNIFVSRIDFIGCYISEMLKLLFYSMLDRLEIQKLFSIKIIKYNKIIRQPGIMSLELASPSDMR